jgi:pyruvate/oxaloacetate carboxyltransferase
MDIFRVFDALNDFRNFQTVVERIKANGKHFQGTICYSLTERRMGGDVFNIDYYLSKAKDLQGMGADTLCLKDMAGIMAPFDIAKLITELKNVITIPIHLHTHYTSGMASMIYIEAIKAGVDIVDTCLAPFALRTSQPAVEPLVATLMGTTRDTGFDLDTLLDLDEYIETIAPKYRDYLASHRMSVIDTGVLAHQVPGGMISNLVSQLKEANALDRINEVYEEVAVTRRELGMPPLVTPTSQIVGVQSVFNVLLGRYTQMTQESMDLAMGWYGKTPIAVDEEVKANAIKRNKKRAGKVITDRVGELLEPELDTARQKGKDLIKDDFDLLIVALYPSTGIQFLKWKYGLEERPPELKPKTLEDIRKEDEAMAAAIEQVCKASF